MKSRNQREGKFVGMIYPAKHKTKISLDENGDVLIEVTKIEKKWRRRVMKLPLIQSAEAIGGVLECTGGIPINWPVGGIEWKKWVG